MDDPTLIDPIFHKTNHVVNPIISNLQGNTFYPTALKIMAENGMLNEDNINY